MKRIVLFALLLPWFTLADEPTPAPPAEPPSPAEAEVEVSALDAAIALAKKENKMLMVDYGWEKCGNCKNFDRLVASGKVVIPEKDFVRVNVSPIAGTDRAKFTKYYGIKQGVYPRIVIVSPEGEVLAKRFGFGVAKQYNDLMELARVKLGAGDR